MSEAIMILDQAKQIYEDHYTVVDKRTCKVKRNIALIHIRMENYPDALKELNEVLELEVTLFGENSQNVAKTYKVIGTLL